MWLWRKTWVILSCSDIIHVNKYLWQQGRVQEIGSDPIWHWILSQTIPFQPLSTLSLVDKLQKQMLTVERVCHKCKFSKYFLRVLDHFHPIGTLGTPRLITTHPHGCEHCYHTFSGYISFCCSSLNLNGINFTSHKISNLVVTSYHLSAGGSPTFGPKCWN